MRNVCKLILAVGLLIVGLGATANATPVTSTASAPTSSAAASCYDNKKEFTKPTAENELPSGQGWWKTTSNCADINMYLNTNGRYVKVLVYATKPAIKPWCSDSGYVWVPNKSWKVIRSDVPNGQYFSFCFKDLSNGVNAAASGYAAA